MERRKIFECELPLPTRVNAAYVICNSRNGRHTLRASDEYVAFKQEAALKLRCFAICDWLTIKAIANAAGTSRQRMTLAVEIDFYFSTWASDIDGRVKSAIDAVFTFLQINDNNIVDLHVTKNISPDDTRCDFRVYTHPQ